MSDEMKKLITAVKTELKSEITGVWTELGRVNEKLDGHDVWLRDITTEVGQNGTLTQNHRHLSALEPKRA